MESKWIRNTEAMAAIELLNYVFINLTYLYVNIDYKSLRVHRLKTDLLFEIKSKEFAD